MTSADPSEPPGHDVESEETVAVYEEEESIDNEGIAEEEVTEDKITELVEGITDYQSDEETIVDDFVWVFDSF